MPQKETPLLQLHLAVFIWGFTGILGKAISLTAFVIVWYRMLIAFVILGCIITIRKEWQRMSKKDLMKLSGIGCLFAVHWISFFASVKYANASVGMICLATSGIFTVLLSSLLKRERINLNELLIGFVALAGVFCIYALQPPGSKSGYFKNYGLGVMLGILASFISALFTVFNKPLTQRYTFRTLVFYEMLSGFICICIASAWFIHKNPDALLLPQGYDYLWLLLLGYCCTVWGQSLAMNSLKYLSPFTVTLTVNLEPVYGIIIAFIIYQENKQLGYGFYIGVALIFISIVLNSLLVYFQKKRL